MDCVEKEIEVGVPLTVAYDQWTQVEEFPRFMEGVERVEQIDDRNTRWTVKVAGVTREYQAQITVQRPDRRIRWHTLAGPQQSGEVSFTEVGADRTRVHLRLEWDPEGAAETVGAALGVVERRAEGDLKRFRDFIEERGRETGAWRGGLEDASGLRTTGDDDQGEPRTPPPPSGSAPRT